MGGKKMTGNKMATLRTQVHLSLQGKGGVGKTMVASILVQYFRERGTRVVAVDADPVNHSLAQYRSLAVSELEVLSDGRVDQRKFDGLVERLLTEEGTYVLDSGASTFIPLWYYMLENQVLDCLYTAGCGVVVHSVVTGGQALADTLSGFAQIAQTTNKRNIVVWLNEYFGYIQQDGALFSQMAVYQENAEKVLGSVQITRRNQDTFGRDIEEMIGRKFTFTEALRSGEFSIMAKQRLKIVRDDLYEQLDELDLSETSQAVTTAQKAAVGQ
jgi:CobQ/CobB/MinD/ParA family nucleotide binding protein